MGHVLLPDLADRLPAGLDAPDGGLDLTPAQVVELGQIEHHADAAHGEHEHQENRFFRGPGHVALHLLETWVAVALENPRHAEAVKEVLACQEANLQRVSEHHLYDVEAGDPFLPPNLGALSMGEAPRGVGDLLHFQAVRLLLPSSAIAAVLNENSVYVAELPRPVPSPVVSFHYRIEKRVAPVFLLGRLVDRVSDEAEAGGAHQYYLEDPVADMRNREGFIIAGLVAAGLQSVADEHGLLVLVHGLTNNSHDQDTEDHHYCQQNPAGETER